MTIPGGLVGRSMPSVTVPVERGRLQFFAEATGQSDPVYTDLASARAAGHPDLPVPPTFLFGLKLEGRDPFGWMRELGIDLRFVLHAGQRFVYHRMAYAGDLLAFHPRIADVYQKKHGALEFVVVDTEIARGRDSIALMSETIAVQHPDKDVAA